MPSLEAIVAVIEKSNLVAPEVIAQLRRKLEKSAFEVDLRSAVKWLVSKEHITLAQGQRLLEQQSNQAETRAVAAADAEDELELLPLDDQRLPVRPGARRAADDEEDAELFPPQAPSSPARRAGGGPGAARWAGTPGEQPAAAARPAGQGAGAARRAEPRPARPASQPPVAPPTGGIDDLFGEGALHQAALADADESNRRGKPDLHRNVWDSPLLLIGGGSLLLLVLIGAVLLWRLNRVTGDEALRAAEDDYRAGSYAQAINKFDHYLETYESHTGVSLARVHRGMAQMRQSVDNSRDWPRTLANAQQIIQRISTEEKFSEARPELAALLPTIAEGLANQAAEKPNRDRIEQSREALAMIDKYVPRTLRPNQRVSQINASLAMTTRTLNRGASLKKAISAIDKAVEAGDAQAAYEIRRQLLKSYPDVASSEELQQAVAAVSQAQRGGVRYEAQPKPAETGEAASPVATQLAISSPAGGSAPGVGGQVVYALASGSAWGVDATSGRLLWRRFVGFDTDYVPRAITADPGSDALVVDAARHEVLRVDALTGQPRWRHSVGEPFDAHPVVLRNRLFLATRSGRLITLELDTGDSPGFVQMPQGLRVGPAVASREQVLYQLGESANLFVLSTEDGECHDVVYLGHETESIRVPPLVVDRYVFIAENRGANDAVLHVLLADKNGLSLHQAQDDIALRGHVLAPLLNEGRTLVVATDRGALYSYEIAPPEQSVPLTRSTEKPADDANPIIRYSLYRAGQLWIAGSDLTRYDIQPTQGRLDPRWNLYSDNAFLQPPRVIGDVLFHVRRKGKLPGAAVSAINSADGSRFWETQIAMPPAGKLFSSPSGGLVAATAAGGLIHLDAARLASGGTVESAALAAGLDAMVSSRSVSLLEDGRLAVTPPGESTAWISAADGWQTLSLPGVLTAPGVAFRGGLVAPTREGLVFVLDPRTAQNILEPFQPRLEAGVEFDWSPPVVLNENELLIADGRSKLYRLGVADQPQPHLVALAEADADYAIKDPMVVLGTTAYAVTAGSQLAAYELPELVPGKSWPIDGELAWGPAQVGSRLLLSTAGQELFCLDEQQNVWQKDLPAPLAGAPLADGEDLIVAMASGVIYRLNAATGEETGSLDVGQPLAAGPMSLGDRLVVAASDGTLLVVETP